MKTNHHLKLPRTGQNAAVLYALTMIKQEYIESQSFKYVCKWGCQFLRDLENNFELKAFVDFVDMNPHLDPWDRFFGCRTNALHLYHQIQTESDAIQYDDIISLFPSVYKLSTWPPQDHDIQFWRVEHIFRHCQSDCISSQRPVAS